MARQNLVFDPSSQQWVPGETPRTMGVPFEGPVNHPLEVRVAALEQGMGGGDGSSILTTEMEVLEVTRDTEGVVNGLAVRRVRIVDPLPLAEGQTEPTESYTFQRGRAIADVTWDTENHKFVRNAMVSFQIQAEEADTETPGMTLGADEDVTECTSLADVIAAVIGGGI